MFTESQKRSRGEALAEAFFYRMDQELVVSLRKKLDREQKIRSFETMTGMKDLRIVEHLVDAGFELSTLTAFIWAPVVFVAWADGKVDQLERSAIAEALPSRGVPQESVKMMISHDWFANRPTEELWNIWEEFASAWLAELSQEDREAVLDEIVELCYVVAQASGGFLGIGRVSQVETEVIDRVLKQQMTLQSE